MNFVWDCVWLTCLLCMPSGACTQAIAALQGCLLYKAFALRLCTRWLSEVCGFVSCCSAVRADSRQGRQACAAESSGHPCRWGASQPAAAAVAAGGSSRAVSAEQRCRGRVSGGMARSAARCAAGAAQEHEVCCGGSGCGGRAAVGGGSCWCVACWLVCEAVAGLRVAVAWVRMYSL